MNFRLDVVARTPTKKKSRPLLLAAVVLGIYALFLLLFVFLPMMGFLAFMALAHLPVALFHTVGALVILFLLASIFRPAKMQQPYQTVWITDTGIYSENGELRLNWQDVSRLSLRHQVLVLGLRDETDLQLDVRAPGFPASELETFAFACIRLAEREPR